MAVSCTYSLQPYNYYLPAAQQEPYKKAYFLTTNKQKMENIQVRKKKKNIKKVRRMDHYQKNDQTER